MLKRYLFLVLTIGLPVWTQGSDCINWYLRAFGGYNYLPIDEHSDDSRMSTEGGFAVGGSLGISIFQLLRLEGETSYRRNPFNALNIDREEAQVEYVEGHLSSLSCMCNGILNLPFKLILQPYIGGGAGYCHEWGNCDLVMSSAPADASIGRFKKTGLAYQVLAGLTILQTSKVAADIEYHFLDALLDSGINRNHTAALSCSLMF